MNNLSGSAMITGLTEGSVSFVRSSTASLKATAGNFATVNGLAPAAIGYDADALSFFGIDTGDGDDLLTIDFGGLNPIPTSGALGSGIRFRSGAGFNTLAFRNGTFVAESYAPGLPGAGLISLTGASPIDFEGLAPIDDALVVTDFTFVAPAGDLAIDVVDGPTTAGFVTTRIVNPEASPAFELINFANKTNARIVATDASSHSIDVDNPNPGFGLASLRIDLASGVGVLSVRRLGTGGSASFNLGGGNDYAPVDVTTLSAGAVVAVDGEFGIDSQTIVASNTTAATGTRGVATFGNGATLDYKGLESVDVHVRNVAPTAIPSRPITVFRGRTFVDQVVAVFTDVVGEPANYLAVIDWGDGTAPTVGRVAADPANPGPYHVSGSHIYLASGAFQTAVTIQDDGAVVGAVVGVPIVTHTPASGGAAGFGAVANTADLPIEVHASNLSVVEGTPFFLEAAYFVDPSGTD